MFHKKFCFGKLQKDGYLCITEPLCYSEERGFGFVFDTDAEGRPMQSVGFSDMICFGKRDDVPLRFDVLVPHMGTYHVRVTIFDENDDTTLSILSEWRRFIRTDEKIKKGENYICDFTVQVCDIHHTDEERYVDRVLNLAFLGDAKISTVEITETDAPTVYIAGDSTVTDQPASYPYHPERTYCGWGQRLGEFLLPGIAVSNHAESGKTTETFKGNLWSVVKERMKKGDYLLMGFGHNDQKIEALGAFTGYYQNLSYYVDYARSVGATPILCTPINRIIFEPDGSLRDLLGEYGAAVRALAKEKQVACIDLLKKTTDYFTAQGNIRAWHYFWGDGTNRDYTHTNDFGARIIAQFAAQGILEQNIMPLAKFVRTDCIDVAFPAKLKKTETAAEPMHGIKPPEQIGLVNVPKLTDLEGLENEDIVRELSSRGYLDAVDGDRFAAEEPLTVRSAADWAARAAGVKTIEEPEIAITDEPVTREQLACLFIASYNYRAPDRAIVGNIDCYTDRAEITPIFWNDVCAANELGVLKGKTDTLYDAKGTFTRGEAADILYKLVYTK